jgi:hypothetical protein
LVAVINGANLYFAALDVLGDVFAQSGFCVSKLIGQSEAEV